VAKKTAIKKVVKKATAIKSKAKPSAKNGAGSADFAEVFDGLKTVMAAFAPQLHVTKDEPKKYYLVTKSKSWRGGPMYFGAVILGKAYISYHLMPLYVCPDLAKTISPELRKRMQGKSCFNFRSVDDALFAELGELTSAGLEKYRAKSWL